jgi:hypothetical protein
MRLHGIMHSNFSYGGMAPACVHLGDHAQTCPFFPLLMVRGGLAGRLSTTGGKQACGDPSTTLRWDHRGSRHAFLLKLKNFTSASAWRGGVLENYLGLVLRRRLRRRLTRMNIPDDCPA